MSSIVLEYKKFQFKEFNHKAVMKGGVNSGN